MPDRRALLWTLLGGLGLWQLGAGLWIPAKARLAQYLLEDAWQETLQTGVSVRPWPWADTWPAARLQVPARGIALIVLQGDSGRTLAFGPGLAAASRAWDTTLISGHRDTHFRFLEHLVPGEDLWLENTAGVQHYRVVNMEVIDSRVTAVHSQYGNEELILLTCYPFDAVTPGGPLRYLVRALPVYDA